MELDRDSQGSMGPVWGWISADPRDRLARFVADLAPEEKENLIESGQDVHGALAVLDAARHREFVLSLSREPGGPGKTTMLYEVGARLPDAVVMRAADVKPGDLYWGVQEENPRKGWRLLAEPATATEGAMPAGDGSTGALSIGSYVGHQPDTLVLVQRRATAEPSQRQTPE